jgi:preprotein translocase subunit SecE
MKKIVRFFQESYAELRKVIWPSRDEVGGSTKVVIISIVIIAISLGFIDLVIYELLNFIF